MSKDRLVSVFCTAYNRHHVTDSNVLCLVDDSIPKWKFQLLYTQGKAKELRRPPYNRLLK